MTFERHNVCLNCGYDLFGQPRNGVCPECGTSTRESSLHDRYLSLPGNVARLRSGAMLVLISSILCGACPGVCLLFLASQTMPVAMLMTLVFAATAITATLGQQRLGAILRSADDGAEAAFKERNRRPRPSDYVAGVGLTSLNLAAYVAAIAGQLDGTTQCMLAGVGFLLLSVTAWRTLDDGRLQSRAAVACLGPRTFGLAGLGAVKAFYETIWLCTCWMTFAVIPIAHGDAAIFFAFGALFGLMGFAGVWLAMMIVHAVLFARVRQFTRALGGHGFEVIPRTV